MKLTTQFNNLFTSFFAEKESPKKGETAWGEDMAMYSSGDFKKYNPDDLIGKKGDGIYKKMMQDEQVKAVVKFKRDAITSRDFDFIFSEDAKEALSEEEQLKRRRLFIYIVSNMRGSFIDILNGVISGMYYGFSLTEKIYNLVEYQGQSWVGIEKLRLRPFDTFDFHVDEYGNIIKLMQKIDNREQELDINDFIHYVHNPEIDDHYGQSDLREAYRAWFSKDIIIKYQNIFLGRYASGFIWATIEGYDETSPEFIALKSVLTNIQTKTAIIVPDGVELHVETPKTTDAYECAVAQQDKAIAKALLVPNLIGITEQGDTGSYAQSETQLEAFLWTLDADASRLAEVIDEDVFRQIGDMNWGDGFYPKFEFKPVSETMKIRLIKIWCELLGKRAVNNTKEDEDHIRSMLKFPPSQEDDDDLEDDDTDPGNTDPDSNDLPDETIIGIETIKSKRMAAFSSATKRVDFAAIDRNADAIAYKQGDLLADVVSRGLQRTLDTIPVDIEPKSVAKIKLPSDVTQGIRATISSTIKDGWKLGQQHASIEIKRAEREASRQFSRVNMASIEKEAAKYFDAQSFIIAGEISDKLTQIIKSSVMIGIQYSKTSDEIIDDIYQRAASKGLISKEAAIARLGDTLKAEVPDHMLATIIRTSSFNAINESRDSYFKDPELSGFVEAFEYSAILDSRTTEICNELGGLPHIHSTSWAGWDKYRPPNHHNCRALLIPVTVADTWQESSTPTNQPHEGFG